MLLKGHSRLPPSKKFMKWHKSEVPWFEKIKHEYEPHFTENYSLAFKILDIYLCLLFATFTVPATSFGKQKFGTLKVRQMLRAKLYIPPRFNDDFSIRFQNRYVSTDVTNSKG